MAYSSKFPVTLPIDINFFNAESVSPVKLNSIFNYLKLANTSIEMYLGNGIDYSVTDNEKKKIIGNLSNVIGDISGNIYMPYNYFSTIYDVYKKYCSQNGNIGSLVDFTSEHATYNSVTDSIEILDTINIPIQTSFDYISTVGAVFTLTTSGTAITAYLNFSVTTISGEDDSIVTTTQILTSPNTALGISLQAVKLDVPANSFISHITLSNAKNTNLHFNVMSLFLIKKQDQNILNAFYALGKTHKSLYVCNMPCKWSDTTFNTAAGGENLCQHRTANGACIGNIYDTSYDNASTLESKSGIPKCGGVIKTQGHVINNTLVTYKSGNSGAVYEYSSDYTGAVTPSYYVLQSPLLTYNNKPHSLKYFPILMTKTSGMLQQAEAFIYDYKSTAASPLSYEAHITSTERYDIVRVSNKTMNISDNTKYIFISSEIGIGAMINEMMTISSISTGRTSAVYAD